MCIPFGWDIDTEFPELRNQPDTFRRCIHPRTLRSHTGLRACNYRIPSHTGCVPKRPVVFCASILLPKTKNMFLTEIFTQMREYEWTHFVPTVASLSLTIRLRWYEWMMREIADTVVVDLLRVICCAGKGYTCMLRFY